MRIGILGGGQLAMMMAESASKKYDIEFIVVDPTNNPPASKYARCIKAKYTDSKALKLLAKECDIVTIDFENVSSSALKHLEKYIPVYPNSESVEICQDRLSEKTLFVENNIPTTKFCPINSENDLKSAIKKFGPNSILKSRRLGYDGKNQIIVNNKTSKNIWSDIGCVPSILEEKVDFLTEVSLIGVKLQSGETYFYPLVENFHRDGILSYSIAPYENLELQKKAETIHKQITKLINYVGVLVIEFFVNKDNQLLANEMAPRVHNSGHWTIEGANISQFRAHIKSIIGEEISDIKVDKYAAMMNILSIMPDFTMLDFPDLAKIHDYGKTERKGRKLGHITIIDEDKNQLLNRIKELGKSII